LPRSHNPPLSPTHPPDLPTLSLHDALPIYLRDVRVTGPEAHGTIERFGIDATVRLGARIWQIDRRFNDPAPGLCVGVEDDEPQGDRKSTRLNSSHVSISYAVFCLKKKNRRD